MEQSHTIITTFGYKHGEPPPADVVFDVRTAPSDDYPAWKELASGIADMIEPGSSVAIGCNDGDDRSIHIAKLVQKLLPDCDVVDRDIDIHKDDHNEGQDKMPLLKGSSKEVVGENIREMKHAGRGEREATIAAAKAKDQKKPTPKEE